MIQLMSSESMLRLIESISEPDTIEIGGLLMQFFQCIPELIPKSLYPVFKGVYSVL